MNILNIQALNVLHITVEEHDTFSVKKLYNSYGYEHVNTTLHAKDKELRVMTFQREMSGYED